jgi:hypothetical protein
MRAKRRPARSPQHAPIGANFYELLEKIQERRAWLGVAGAQR